MTEMRKRAIFYRIRGEYELSREYTVRTPFRPPAPVRCPYVVLYPSGRLLLRRGFPWDGPSGPAVDTPSFMRGSACHDAIYRLLRVEPALQLHAWETEALGMPAEERCASAHPEWRKMGDDLMYRLCLEDGMSRVRAWLCWRAVRRFASGASYNGGRPVIEAP